jgi:hypothetical protein
VTLQGRFDAERADVDLVGPVCFSRAIGGLNRQVSKPPAYLTWYTIRKPKTESARMLKVLDMVRGSADKVLKVTTAEFFVSPSQLITTGVPDSIPEGLDHYKAYRVVDAPSLDREITVTGSHSATKRRLGKPLFVCLAVKEWHHDEHFPASHPNDCFVVYELDEQRASETYYTMDQFGLNELAGNKNHWLCVRAALLSAE